MRRKILTVCMILSLLLCGTFCIGCEEEEQKQEQNLIPEENTPSAQEQTIREEEGKTLLLTALEKTDKAENFKCEYRVSYSVGNTAEGYKTNIKLCHTPEGIEYHYLYDPPENGNEYMEETYYFKPLMTGYLFLYKSESGADITKITEKGKEEVDEDFADEYSHPFSVTENTDSPVPLGKDMVEELLAQQNMSVKITVLNQKTTAYRMTWTATEPIILNGKELTNASFSFTVKDVLSEYVFSYDMTKKIKGENKECHYQESGLFSYSGLTILFPNEDQYPEILK